MKTSLRNTLLKTSVAASLLLVSGCSLAPNRVQYPSLWFQAENSQRKAAQVQDPYPDASVGPSVGFRPLEFQQQRSVPQQTKDKFYSGFLKRNMGGVQPTPAPANGVPVQGGAVSAVPMNGPIASQPIYSPPMYRY